MIAPTSNPHTLASSHQTPSVIFSSSRFPAINLSSVKSHAIKAQLTTHEYTCILHLGLGKPLPFRQLLWFRNLIDCQGYTHNTVTTPIHSFRLEQKTYRFLSRQNCGRRRKLRNKQQFRKTKQPFFFANVVSTHPHTRTFATTVPS